MRVVAALGIVFAGCSLIYEPSEIGDAAGGAVDGAVDGASPREPCASEPDDVFRYEVTDGPLSILKGQAGGIDGQVLAISAAGTLETGSLDTIVGPERCGSALALDGWTFVEVAHDPAWELGEGTLSFWYRATDEPSVGGLVSKDLRGALEGHVSVYQVWRPGAPLRVVARVQQEGESIYLCSDGLDPETWHEVVIDIGTTWTMWIDGSRAAAGGTVNLIGAEGQCETGAGPMVRLGENQASWIFGASGARRDESGDAASDILGAGAGLDHIRLRGVGR